MWYALLKKKTENIKSKPNVQICSESVSMIATTIAQYHEFVELCREYHAYLNLYLEYYPHQDQ